MKTRKILLAVLALCLLSAVTVTGTLAVFSMQAAAPVTNTFVSNTPSLLRGPDKAFTLTESLVKFENGQNVPDPSARVPSKEFPYNQYCLPVGSGQYVGPNAQISYPLPKDPVVNLSGRTEVPAYLYLEIVPINFSDDLMLNATLTEDWSLMVKDGPSPVHNNLRTDLYRGDLYGPNGGLVYLYTGPGEGDLTDQESYSISVFEGNTVYFEYFCSDGNVRSIDIGLEIYAYLAENDDSDYWYPMADCFHRAFGFENFVYEYD